MFWRKIMSVARIPPYKRKLNAWRPPPYGPIKTMAVKFWMIQMERFRKGVMGMANMYISILILSAIENLSLHRYAKMVNSYCYKLKSICNNRYVISVCVSLAKVVILLRRQWRGGRWSIWLWRWRSRRSRKWWRWRWTRGWRRYAFRFDTLPYGYNKHLLLNQWSFLF